ncbi:MAG: DUF1641 domain-containing protein [Thermoflexales bacterium]
MAIAAIPQTANAEAVLELLVEKVDALSKQVQYLAEQARQAERAREERDELVRDLSLVLKGAYESLSQDLETLSPSFNLEELMQLLKRLLRNVRNLESLLEQLESVTELLEVAAPLSREAFAKFSSALEELDRKGYFAFAKGGLRIVDNIVTSFTEEDVRALGDNIALILHTVKDMTQPEIMQFLRSTVHLAEKDSELPSHISYRALLGQLRDPNVRRGLAILLHVLRGIGAPKQASGSAPGASASVRYS